MLETARKHGEFKFADPDEIIVPEDRIRKEFKKEDLVALAESMQNLIQIQPGVCYLDDKGQTVLVAGERRLRAAKIAKLPFAFLLLDEVDELFILEIEIEENKRRTNLTWQEEAASTVKLKAAKEKYIRQTTMVSTATVSQRDLAKELEVSKFKVQEDLELAAFAQEFPEVAKCKTASEAKKEIKKLRSMVNRAKLLSTATDLAHESKALTDAAVQENKPVTKDESTISIAGFKLSTEKVLDFQRRIICGDMEEKIEQFKDGSIDLMFFDPPWGVGIDELSGQQYKTFVDDPKKVLKNYKRWLSILYRKMSENSHLYMFFGIVHYQFIYHVLRRSGFKVNGLPIDWIKQGVSRTERPEDWPGRAIERIAFAKKGSKKLQKLGAPDYIITPGPTQRMKDIHPDAKHPDVYLELLKRSALPGDVILDPMAGSGMLGVAAGVLQPTHRLDWWLIERERPFVDLCVENCLAGYSEITLYRERRVDNATVGKTEPTLPAGLDYKILKPGSPDWQVYWRTHPEQQKEMAEWAMGK